MSPEQAAIILNTVYQRTKEGKVPWTETVDETAYEASFEDYTIRMTRESERDESSGEFYAIYYLEILNDEGKPVSSIRPHQVDRYIDKPWEFTGDLFSNARDKALGVDKIAVKMLKDLGGAVPPPKLAAKSGYDETLDEEEIPF
jgi:hypothetical protein